MGDFRIIRTNWSYERQTDEKIVDQWNEQNIAGDILELVSDIQALIRMAETPCLSRGQEKLLVTSQRSAGDYYCLEESGVGEDL